MICDPVLILLVDNPCADTLISCLAVALALPTVLIENAVNPIFNKPDGVLGSFGCAPFVQSISVNPPLAASGTLPDLTLDVQYDGSTIDLTGILI